MGFQVSSAIINRVSLKLLTRKRLCTSEVPGLQERTRHCSSVVNNIRFHLDGLVQERHNPSALTVKLRLSCNNPSIYNSIFKFPIHGLNESPLFLSSKGNFKLITRHRVTYWSSDRADKRWVRPVKFLCIIMFDISKIRPKWILSPGRAQKFSRCPDNYFRSFITMAWLNSTKPPGNGLVLSGNKPLPDPMLTQFLVALWRR